MLDCTIRVNTFSYVIPWFATPSLCCLIQHASSSLFLASSNSLGSDSATHFPLVYFLHLLVLQIERMCLYLWGSFGFSHFYLYLVLFTISTFGPICRNGVPDCMLCLDGWAPRPCCWCRAYSWVGVFFNREYSEKCCSCTIERWFPFCPCWWYGFLNLCLIDSETLKLFILAE